MKKLLLLTVAVAFCLFFPLSIFLAGEGENYSVIDGKISSEYDLDKYEAIAKIVLSSEDGISFRLTTEEKTLVKKMKAQEVKKEYLDGVTSTYYYSPYIRRYIVADGKKINMQIAVDIYGNVTLGTPIIMGSY